MKPDVPFITSCTTNGTLIDDNNREWLKRHRNVFFPVLSYDGDYEMQQKNRNTSKAHIDMNFFKDTWPEESVHLTISKETLPYLSRGILSLQRSGGNLDATLAQGVEWTDEDANMYRDQLNILKEAYLQDVSLKPINLLGRTLYGITGQQGTQKKFCGTGTSMIAYDIDGKSYPCHMFSPIVLGYDRALELSASGIKDDCHITDSFCKNCNIMHWCPSCYGFNYRFRSDISLRDHHWCKMIHTQVVACCEFQIAYFHKHMKILTDADMAQLKAALEAYHILSNNNSTISFL